MAKENTHLYIADLARSKIRDKRISRIISSNMDYYLLGSVIADSFYYTAEKPVSEYLHSGKNRQIIASLLSGNSKELAFAFGYITHWASDRVFHAEIDTILHAQPKKSISYLHWHIETFVDSQLKHKLTVNNGIDLPKDAGFLIGRLGRHAYLKAIRRQQAFNKAFLSKVCYNLFRLLSKAGLFNKKYLSLFYENLGHEGFSFKLNIKKAVSESVSLSLSLISSAYDYSAGKTPRKQLLDLL